MIFHEGENDEILLMALGRKRAELLLCSGKGRVAVVLSKSQNSGACGVVDQDLGQPPPRYFRKFTIIEECAKLGLVLSKHPTEGKHLIEIQPDLEPWLYRIGPAVGIKPIDHHLPDKPSVLHQEAKKHRKHLIAYLCACQAAGSPHLAKLSDWLAL